ncbi:MAG: hypothetical protein IT424_00605 [Pirellulales bacterium]|nr:hypothetical protein [Pirellulales bacterium]
MAGGNCQEAHRRCARLWAAVALSGWFALAAPAASIADPPEENVVAASGGQRTGGPSERSIVIDAAQATGSDPEVALATDRSADALEPIADSSEYGPAPDLADDPRLPPTPTLADPPEPTDDAPPAFAEISDAAGPTSPSAGRKSLDDEAGAAASTSTEMFQAASFNGIVPGASTRSEVLAAWGRPLEKNTAGKTLTFDLEGFQNVTLTFNKDRVAAIRVELSTPSPADALAQKLNLAAYRPVRVEDDEHYVVSTTYPERGVSFGHTPGLGAAVASDDAPVTADGSETVHELVMRPIEPAPFLRRAEATATDDYGRRIADLQTALDLDGRDARAAVLLSQAKLAVGQALEAEDLARLAVDQEPANDDYRLQWAKCLEALGRGDEAAAQTRAVLEGTTATQLVRADALQTLAQLTAQGPAAQRPRALSLYNKAIELADELAAQDSSGDERRIHRVLLEAHLGICQQIAGGDFQNKSDAVEQWLSRASALAEHMIAQGEADVSLRVTLAVKALAAGGRLNPPLDPALWVAEAEQAAAEVEPKLHDSLALEALHWRLGQTYSVAAEIQHRRGQAELALQYGEHADAHMTPLRSRRSELPQTDYELGRVYFQIGAVHAVHRQDHDAACQWYDRAAELLLPATPASLAQAGQYGDSLVSMGVSYWETGNRERAYELTKAGAAMIEQGVADGVLPENSRAVPQNNLAAMTQALGVADELAAPKATGPARLADQRSGGRQAGGRAKSSARVADRQGVAGDSGVRRR